MSSVCSDDSSVLATPNSALGDYESPWVLKRTTSNDAQEVRQPRFPGRRGSAAGQLDLVTQASKGLGPTLRHGEEYKPAPKALRQYDLQSQARYGLGPTVSVSEPISERRGPIVQHDLLSQAIYGHGMTVPVNQAVTEGPKRTNHYDLATQAAQLHPNVNLKNPYGNKRAQETFDLSSQYRKFL